MNPKTRQECVARKAFLAFQSPSCQLYSLSHKLRINVLPWNEKGGPPGSHFGSIFARGCVGQECLKGQWYAWNGTKNLDNAAAEGSELGADRHCFAAAGAVEATRDATFRPRQSIAKPGQGEAALCRRLRLLLASCMLLFATLRSKQTLEKIWRHVQLG